MTKSSSIQTAHAPTADEMNRRTGLWENLPYEQYEQLEGLRKTCLYVLYQQTPKHYLHALTSPPKETDALRIGSATHTIIWEPDAFESRYLVAPPPPPIPSRPEVQKWNRTYKEHKAAWAEIVNAAAEAGKTILDDEEYDKLRFMRDNLHAHPQAHALIAAAKPEVSLQWRDPYSGLLLKGRLDGLVDLPLVLDLKTAQTAEPTAFGRDGYRRGYPFQMAMYHDGVREITGKTPELPVLIVVENTAPYAVACIQLSQSDLSTGRGQYQATLDRLKQCVEENRWPGYEEGLIPFVMPSWAGTELSAAG